MNRVRVGIAGFGTIGRATAAIIAAHADLIAKRSGVRLEVTSVELGQLPIGNNWSRLTMSM